MHAIFASLMEQYKFDMDTPFRDYPEKIQTKSNWDFEQEWDYTAVEQVKSKPRELIKVVTKKK